MNLILAVLRGYLAHLDHNYHYHNNDYHYHNDNNHHDHDHDHYNYHHYHYNHDNGLFSELIDVNLFSVISP
mgnify:CR=1 FL=1